ncbi:MAG TPA: EamA family transporter, partial [Gaiellaceae bacterium]|nr:EamA family transporter [Gaiellaceae bacterium]
MRFAAALGTIYLVWGSTYFAIAVADRSLPPLLMLAVRFAIAGALLYAWCWKRGAVREAELTRRDWRNAAIVGGLLLVIDTGGVAVAEQHVASGLAALLIATVPLFMAVLDRAVLGVRVPAIGAAGILA